MKEYPLTESDLFSLGLLQGGSSLSLAASGACLGAWVSIKQTVQFAGKEVPAALIGWWDGVGSVAFGAAIFFGAIGAIMALISGIRVYKVIKDTSHER